MPVRAESPRPGRSIPAAVAGVRKSGVVSITHIMLACDSSSEGRNLCHAHPPTHTPRNGTPASARPSTSRPSTVTRNRSLLIFILRQAAIGPHPKPPIVGAGIAPPSWVFDRTPNSKQLEGLDPLSRILQGWALTIPTSQSLLSFSIFIFL